MPKSQTSTTTGHSRRHRHFNVPVSEELGFISRFVSGTMQAEPATTAVPPRPFGDLSTATIERIAQLSAVPGEGSKVSRVQRSAATTNVLAFLADFPGETWQQRWDASPLGRGEISAAVLGSSRTGGYAQTMGARALFYLRVVQPTVLAFRRQGFNEYNALFIVAQSDPLLDKFVEHVHAHDLTLSSPRFGGASQA